MLQLPEDGATRLKQRRAELEEELARLDRDWPQNESVRIEEGRLVLTPLSAEEPPEGSVALQEKIAQHLPRVDLADLLLEVDSWTDFTRHFEHAGGREPRSKDLRVHLHASILAQACNFGPTTMAEVAELSYRRLAWCTNWYLREDTLRPAIAAVVDFQHRQPLSRSWGGGTLSSSDGQRFPVPVRSRTATALPRYFGYGQGLTFYTWTSDQFAQYGTKVIPATVRDATYVLDAILDNETELTILEHTTDTAGYTELVFALFDLLGMQFAPASATWATSGSIGSTPGRPTATWGRCSRARSASGRVVDHWDDLLRVAGSLKRGHVTASLLIGKLQANPRRNALTRALQEYGRVAKTLFVLRYLGSEAYRRRIGVQLNKGEALHALRRFLFFAHQGQVRRGQPEDQANQASCLNLVTNAVIAWNTVYMAAVIDRLKVQGGADRPRGPRAPLAGPVRPHQPVRAIPVPGRPLGRQEALTTHQGVSQPAKRSVGFCPFAIPRPDRLEHGLHGRGDRPAEVQGGADRPRGPRAPLPGSVRPHQPIRAISVPGSTAGPARSLCGPSRCEPTSQAGRWFLSVCYPKAGMGCTRSSRSRRSGPCTTRRARTGC